MKYTPTPEDLARDVNNFAHHAPFGDQTERYADNRKAVLGLAILLRGNCPPSRELSLALTKLEECLMYANGAIARGEKP